MSQIQLRAVTVSTLVGLLVGLALGLLLSTPRAIAQTGAGSSERFGISAYSLPNNSYGVYVVDSQTCQVYRFVEGGGPRNIGKAC